jgi:hypothetical protein
MQKYFKNKKLSTKTSKEKYFYGVELGATSVEPGICTRFL